MKKLMTLTAVGLMCLSLLCTVPKVKAYETEVPASTEETIPDTAVPCDLPELKEENV